MPTGRPNTVLPGAEAPTARGMAQMAYQKQAQYVQDTFKKQWDSIAGKSKKLGDKTTRDLLNKLQQKAGVAAQRMTKQFNEQSMYLDQIQSLSDAGMISNGDELMWRAVAGNDVARSMYPSQKPQSSMDKFKQEEQKGRMLDRELERFQESDTRGRFAKWHGFGGAKTETQTQTWNPDKGKSGGWDWKKSTASEDSYFKQLKGMRKQNESLKQILLSGGKLSRNAATMALKPGNHSSFVDKTISQSIQQTPPPKPPSRSEKLAEYRRLGGSQSEAGRQFADKHLR